MDQQNNSNPQVLYEWSAPLRPFIKRSKKIIRFYVALTLLLSLIIAFFGDIILLIPLWALMFIFYVFTVTPPTDITNKITKFGVETVGTNLRWETLDHFYFTKRFGYEILTIVTHPPYDFHTYLVIPINKVKDDVTQQLSKHIIYQEAPVKTTIDKIIDRLSMLVPHEEGENEGVKNHTPINVTPTG
ncbi:MAG: hypothetical protein WEC80_02415 [Patescibacteria group bacterium]